MVKNRNSILVLLGVAYDSGTRLISKIKCSVFVICYTLKKHYHIFNLCLQGENLTTQYQPRHLLELLEIIFCQFRCVANIHNIVLQNLHRIIVSTDSIGMFLNDRTNISQQICNK